MTIFYNSFVGYLGNDGKLISSSTICLISTLDLRKIEASQKAVEKVWERDAVLKSIEEVTIKEEREKAEVEAAKKKEGKDIRSMFKNPRKKKGKKSKDAEVIRRRTADPTRDENEGKDKQLDKVKKTSKSKKSPKVTEKNRREQEIVKSGSQSDIQEKEDQKNKKHKKEKKVKEKLFEHEKDQQDQSDEGYDELEEELQESEDDFYIPRGRVGGLSFSSLFSKTKQRKVRGKRKNKFQNDHMAATDIQDCNERTDSQEEKMEIKDGDDLEKDERENTFRRSGRTKRKSEHVILEGYDDSSELDIVESNPGVAEEINEPPGKDVKVMFNVKDGKDIRSMFKPKDCESNDNKAVISKATMKDIDQVKRVSLKENKGCLDSEIKVKAKEEVDKIKKQNQPKNRDIRSLFSEVEKRAKPEVQQDKMNFRQSEKETNQIIMSNDVDKIMEVDQNKSIVEVSRPQEEFEVEIKDAKNTIEIGQRSEKLKTNKEKTCEDSFKDQLQPLETSFEPESPSKQLQKPKKDIRSFFAKVEHGKNGSLKLMSKKEKAVKVPPNKQKKVPMVEPEKLYQYNQTASESIEKEAIKRKSAHEESAEKDKESADKESVVKEEKSDCNYKQTMSIPVEKCNDHSLNSVDNFINEESKLSEKSKCLSLISPCKVYLEPLHFPQCKEEPAPERISRKRKKNSTENDIESKKMKREAKTEPRKNLFAATADHGRRRSLRNKSKEIEKNTTIKKEIGDESSQPLEDERNTKIDVATTKYVAMESFTDFNEVTLLPEKSDTQICRKIGRNKKKLSKVNSQHGNIKEELAEPSSADRGDTSLRRSSRARKQVVSYSEEDLLAKSKKKNREGKSKGEKRDNNTPKKEELPEGGGGNDLEESVMEVSTTNDEGKQGNTLAGNPDKQTLHELNQKRTKPIIGIFFFIISFNSFMTKLPII